MLGWISWRVGRDPLSVCVQWSFFKFCCQALSKLIDVYEIKAVMNMRLFVLEHYPVLHFFQPLLSSVLFLEKHIIRYHHFLTLLAYILPWLFTQAQIISDQEPSHCMKRSNKHLKPSLLYRPWHMLSLDKLNNKMIKYSIGRLGRCSVCVHLVNMYFYSAVETDPTKL